MTRDDALRTTVVARLDADTDPDPERDMLVLGALEGPDALAGYKVVFQAIRELMSPPAQPRRKIGYATAHDR